MEEMIIIIRPEKLEKVKQILDSLGIGGMSISSVMGCGSQRGLGEEEALRGLETRVNLLPKIRVEVVAREDQIEEVITEIRDQVATGHVGDGKIFIRRVEDVVRIRTGERGNEAL